MNVLGGVKVGFEVTAGFLRTLRTLKKFWFSNSELLIAQTHTSPENGVSVHGGRVGFPI
jgi:hypothetical protein